MKPARPIIFSGPMVRAILAGEKTQTRRVVKPQPLACESVQYDPVTGSAVYESDEDARIIDCPYGSPGIRLWVRECLRFDPDFGWRYDAGPKAYPMGNTLADIHGQLDRIDFSYSRTVCPSIHMPRVASRILLEITAVRVERLQNISFEDANAEGTPYSLDPSMRPVGTREEQYRALWESINGKGAWALNPWVWVISFRRVYDAVMPAPSDPPVDTSIGEQIDDGGEIDL